MSKYQRHKISYCPICGYVDLTVKESNCRHCNMSLEITDEYFDEINLIASTSEGVSMLGDMRSFFASMADATLVPVKVDETTEESVAQTEESTEKPTKAQTEQ